MNTTEKEAPAELVKILTDSHLELSEAETIKQSYLPFFARMGEVKEQEKKINFENPTLLDEQIARNLRLELVDIRKRSEEVKIERKRIHSLKADVEQQTWNVIKATCLLDEERMNQIEKKREIAEKARLEARRQERIAKLAPFNVDIQFIDLVNMPDEGFDKLLAQSELAFEQAKAELAKAEQERIERERAAEEKRLEVIAENKRLREEAEAKEKQLAEERAKAEAEKKKAEAEAKRIADETAKREAEAKAKAEAEQEKMRKEAQAKIEAERKERERVEAQLKQAKEAEAKRIADAEAAKEAELSKGDAAKLADLVKDLEALQTKYVFKSAKNKAVYSEVNILLNKIITHLTVKTK